MTSKEIEQKLKELTNHVMGEDFIYDFLRAYGTSKASVTLLKKGSYNQSRVEGEVLYKHKLFFKKEATDRLLYELDELSTEERILKQKPRFVVLTDGTTIVARDLVLQYNREFAYKELSENYEFFMPLAGGEIYKFTNDNEADRNAAYELAKLYDILIEDNPHLAQGHTHALNIFLARLLFCFFAEDTGIFEENLFTNALTTNTQPDGENVSELLHDLFLKLNSSTPEGHPVYVRHFPYVNGGLFKDEIEIPRFSKRSRDILLRCSQLNWSEINPDIFGSMIQAVADPEERSHLGMHYTSVENILKVIKPLFLDELYEEFEKNRDNERALRKLRNRMERMKFFDPACGSGNFLIITYKELRLLEIKIIQRIIELASHNQKELFFTQISLQQFYGIEIKDFAHEVAMVSLWLAEHQMNQLFESELMGWGDVEPILPLKQAGYLFCTNAATTSWEEVCPRNEGDEIYLIGNPPYMGARKQEAAQKNDMDIVFRGFQKYRDLDYVAIWFYKGARYIENYNAALAFVSTNSICQGQQVPLLWESILNTGNVEIGFAYRSFKWSNNALGNAGVTVVIIGLRNKGKQSKYIFEENIRHEAKNINGYLLDAPNIAVPEIQNSISKFPRMNFGNMPNDGGALIFNEQEYLDAIDKDKGQETFFRVLMGGYEFLNGIKRYCLWIEDEELDAALAHSEIAKRIEDSRKHRLDSRDKGTNKLASRPHQFRDRNVAVNHAIIIPATSSERRDYIPMGFLSPDTIISNSAMAVYDAEPWLFGVLHSRMHMVWVDAVGGKLETRYRYSAKLCYNTFPFPEITDKQKYSITEDVYAVLDERGKHPEKTLAWLYNPETMPVGLKQAHENLDRTIELCYRPTPFDTDMERLEYLFRLYDQMLRQDTLFAPKKKTRNKKK